MCPNLICLFCLRAFLAIGSTFQARHRIEEALTGGRIWIGIISTMIYKIPLCLLARCGSLYFVGFKDEAIKTDGQLKGGDK